jgi:signal transduction histidine kinase
LYALERHDMEHKRNIKGLRVNIHLWAIIAVMVLGSLFYYLPAIGERAGWTSLYNDLEGFHDFYGVDMLGIIFFAPVIYAACALGLIPAVIATVATLLIRLPQAILLDNYPEDLFQLAAFVAILAAVGAAVAMWQKRAQESRLYHEQFEEAVERRTRDMEQVQEKLIRNERLAAVGELASGVGHELRNPLNVIRNCAYLLKTPLAESNEAENVNTLALLDKQIDIANKIITDLLDFTRITPPSPVRVELKSIINESLSWIPLPPQVAVNVRPNGHTRPVLTDPEQMCRVFTNIIANAVQAMNTSGGELNIETGEDGDFVRVDFRDTGCGIPAENMDKIFEPLFTTKPKGIGLGLAISKRLVEENGGRIVASSQPGRGATFTVMLPIEKRSQQA